MKILISDKISETGLELFKKAKGIEVIYEPTVCKDIPKFKTLIADVDALAIRSGSKVTAELINCAKKLKVIGRAGIGVDNVDLEAASKKGIIVMNTPTGNTVTTAEHAISMMCALSRNIPQATASLKSGKWEKSKFMGAELYQKNLGVIGCGNIGKIVVNRAKGLKMNILCHDPFLSEEMASELGIKKVTLIDLLKQSDYITIHTPKNEKTVNLINKEAFKEMKPGVFVINCARGGIVNEKDLEWAIENKLIAGAALDVFESEPVDPKHPLLQHDNVICTPHLGASTDEAQENVAIDVANQIIDYLLNGNIANAVNTVCASADLIQKLGPVIELGKKIGFLHGQLCDESPKEININYLGDIATEQTKHVTTSILQGILQPMLSDRAINAVNAPYLAKERNIQTKVSKTTSHSDYALMIEVTTVFKNSENTIAGTIFGKHNPRIVRYNNVYPEFNPLGQMLIINNNDKPGVIGRIGTFLGENAVNISNLQLCLDPQTKTATAFYSVQGDLNDNLINALEKMDDVISVRSIYFKND